MASNDLQTKRKEVGGAARFFKNTIRGTNLDIKENKRHIEYKDRILNKTNESSKSEQDATLRKAPYSEEKSNKNKFDKCNDKSSYLHEKNVASQETSKNDSQQYFHTKHKTSNEFYSDKSDRVGETKNFLDKNFSKPTYCDDTRHHSFSERTNDSHFNKCPSKSSANYQVVDKKKFNNEGPGHLASRDSYRNVHIKKASNVSNKEAIIDQKEANIYQEKSYTDNEDTPQYGKYNHFIKSSTKGGDKEIDNSLNDNKEEFRETYLSKINEKTFHETHSIDESQVVANTVADLSDITVVNRSLSIHVKNIYGSLNNKYITDSTDKFKNDCFANYVYHSTTESKVEIEGSTNCNISYINNNIRTESVSKTESCTGSFSKCTNNNSIIEYLDKNESSTSSGSYIGNSLDDTSDSFFKSDYEVLISPPIPPPIPLKSYMLNQSPVHTSGYTSSIDLDYLEETVNLNSETKKENCDPSIDHLAALSCFLKAVETKYHKSNELAEKFREDIYNVVRYYFTGNKVVLYGSYYSNLAVNTSDINVALIANQSAKESFFLQLRKKLYEELKDYYVETFETAEIPRKSKIYLSDKENGISCEIVYAGNTIKKYINMNVLILCLCDYDPRLKTLLIAIRIWAEKCAINEADNGSLHIIGFSLMLIHFLQQLKKPVLPVIDITSEDEEFPKVEHNNATVGQLWLDFFQFYSQQFDWKNDVVCITSKERISKTEKSWSKHLIAIEDPFTQKNIGSTVVKSDVTDYIVNCFSNSYEYFVSPSDDEDTNSSQNNSLEDENLKFSFNHCFRLKTTIPICEQCDEIGGPCQECLSLVPIFDEKKLPEISKESLEYVEKVLEEVYGKNMLSYKQIRDRTFYVKQLEEYVRTRYPGASLSLFGSSVNGFGFDSSDLDICMTFKGDTQVRNQQQVMRNLCGLLRRDKQRRYGSVICLYRAVVPLIKFSNLYWKGDISFSNLLAVHNSKLLNAYASYDERCRKLGCALKLLAKKTGIADCTTKSLSSYSYIIMTIHYLQQIEPPVLPVFPIHNKEIFEKELIIPEEILKKNHWFRENPSQLKERYKKICTNTATTGQLWIGLLDFYIKYDTNRAITITQLEPLLSSELSREARLFNIQDPFLPEKNLGGIVSESKAIEIFKIFYDTRILFSKGKPKYVTDLKDHYFSTMNLTGKYEKDKDCPLCGAYGHDKNLCKKAEFQRMSPKKFNHNSYHKRM